MHILEGITFTHFMSEGAILKNVQKKSNLIYVVKMEFSYLVELFSPLTVCETEFVGLGAFFGKLHISHVFFS